MWIDQTLNSDWTGQCSGWFLTCCYVVARVFWVIDRALLRYCGWQNVLGGFQGISRVARILWMVPMVFWVIDRALLRYFRWLLGWSGSCRDVTRRFWVVARVLLECCDSLRFPRFCWGIIGGCQSVEGGCQGVVRVFYAVNKVFQVVAQGIMSGCQGVVCGCQGVLCDMFWVVGRVFLGYIERLLSCALWLPMCSGWLPGRIYDIMDKCQGIIGGCSGIMGCYLSFLNIADQIREQNRK